MIFCCAVRNHWKTSPGKRKCRLAWLLICWRFHIFLHGPEWSALGAAFVCGCRCLSFNIYDISFFLLSIAMMLKSLGWNYLFFGLEMCSIEWNIHNYLIQSGTTKIINHPSPWSSLVMQQQCYSTHHVSQLSLWHYNTKILSYCHSASCHKGMAFFFSQYFAPIGADHWPKLQVMHVVVYIHVFELVNHPLFLHKKVFILKRWFHNQAQ